MKKLNKKLKIVLGILFCILLVLLVVFIFNIGKKEEEEIRLKPIVAEHDAKYIDRSLEEWEMMVVRYYTEKLGYEPSLHHIEKNDKNDLVITIENYDSSIDKEKPILIDIVTIDHLTEKITNKDGNIIELIEDGEPVEEKLEEFNYEE